MPRFRGFFLLGLILILVLPPNTIRKVAAEIPYTDEEILVRFSKGNDVFSPHEVVALEIFPRSSKIFAEKLNVLTVTLHRTTETVGIVRLATRKFPDDSTRLASTEIEIPLPNEPQTVQWVPVSLIMPAAEGIYEIGITFQRKGETNSGHNLLANPLQRRSAKTVVQSVISCVVVNTAPIRRPVGELQIAINTEQPETVDTANPTWWKRFSKVPPLPKIASLPRILGRRSTGTSQASTNAASDAEWSPKRFDFGPLGELAERWTIHGDYSYGSGHFRDQTTVPMITTPLSALSASTSAETVPWEAIPLSIKAPGKPHLLELEYPSGVPQTLGIAVVELIPSDAGPIPTISSESIINVAEEIVSNSKVNRLLGHQIMFWPKTKSPMLLLTNRRPQQDALFGKVNTFQLADDPNGLAHPFGGEPQRLLAGYVHRPEILESLASSIGTATWETFYEGTTRFVDQLQHGGYDGTMFVVAANGKTIYPSIRYGATPWAGSLIGVDGHPTQKDVLELLARLFDREGLTLVPAIDFNSPLPALENAIQRNPNLAIELAWIGPDGPMFLPSDRSGRVNGPFYNLLHPTVQDAMIDAFRELAVRCARHPSFGGVSVILSPTGFAKIPDPFWGIDDITIARFQQETNIELPDDARVSPENISPTRFAAREQFFRTNAVGWETWIRWRTQKVDEFYRRVAQTLTDIRPDTTLYLSGGAMLDSPNLQQYCTPSLLRRVTLTQMLRLIGFDTALFEQTPSMVFLRPSGLATESDSENAAICRELETMEFTATTPRNAFATGALLFHESPPNEEIVIVPGSERNRRRFVKRLAQEDVLIFFDGGSTLPLGEAESLYPVAAAFRKLPKTPFQTFTAKGNAETEKSLQPVTVRFLETPSGLFAYLLNDAPFSVEAKLTFAASPNAPLEELSGRRPIDPAFLTRKDGLLFWSTSLAPYDFVAVRLAESTAALRDVDVYRPMEICGPGGSLKRKIDELGERIQTAKNGVLWDKLENPGCEMETEPTTELAGWMRYGDESFVVAYDPITKYSGKASLKLELKTTSPTFCGILSNVIPSSETGRLFVSAHLGVSNQSPAPPINVVLTATHCGTPLFRSLRIEPEATATDAVRWRKIVVPFDRLPKDDLEDLRIGFQLVGSGTVRIDDVMLYRIAFTKEEWSELYQIASVADRRRSTDRISDLLVLLEGYWLKFLLENVPLEPKPSFAVAENRPAYTENKAETPPKNPELSKPTAPSSVFGRFKGWFTK